MPLAAGSSRETIHRNIAEMIRSGHKPAQAVAAAYRSAGIAKDMSDEDWDCLASGILKFLAEERAEPAHDAKYKGFVIRDGASGPEIVCDSIVIAKAKDAEQAKRTIDMIAADGRFAIAMDRAMSGAIGVPVRFGIAFDRDTTRRYDQDGRLHIDVSPISKANVCPYFGHEIPDWESLGLERDRKYMLLRHPDELAKAAPTFNNIPILSRHVPVSADSHQPDLVIGSTGTDATFDAPYLKNSYVIWAADPIDDIEKNVKRELSSSYRYRADMTPGTHEGEHYDGIMRDIQGNHVALVREGRAGPDVAVGDSAIATATAIMEESMAKQTAVLSRKALMAQGAVIAYLRPKLAADAKIDLGPAFAGLTSKNFAEKKGALVTAIKDATKGKLAKDAEIDDLPKVVDAIEPEQPIEADAEPNGEHPALAMLKDQIPPEMHTALSNHLKANGDKARDAETPEQKKEREEAEARDRAARDAETPEQKAERERQAGEDKKAHDAQIEAAVGSAVKKANATQKAIREAERAVRPYIGDISVACDSADQVYETCLKALGVEVDGVHPSAFPALLRMQPKPGERATKTTMASDAAAAKGFNERFPGAARIGIL
jgi:uncharacterized protein